MSAWRIFLLEEDWLSPPLAGRRGAFFFNNGPHLMPGPCVGGQHNQPIQGCLCGLYYTHNLNSLTKYHRAMPPAQRVIADVTPIGNTWRDRFDNAARRAEALHLNRMWVRHDTPQQRKDALHQRYQVPVLNWRDQTPKPRPAGFINLVPPALRPPKETA
ncbi:hypothetical protein ACWCQ1_21490 [Streptomyces sp. NPDC002144]